MKMMILLEIGNHMVDLIEEVMKDQFQMKGKRNNIKQCKMFSNGVIREVHSKKETKIKQQKRA